MGIACTLIALIVLLAIPVSLSFQVAWRRGFKGDLKLKWLFGLVRVGLPVSMAGRRASEKGAGEQSKQKKPSTDRKSSPLAAIRQSSFRRRLYKFLRDCWRAVHKHDLKLSVRIGLGDPAETGMLWAMVGPASGVLATVPEASIEVKPEFVEAVFELDSSGSIRIVPLQLIYLIIGLLLSPTLWQGIKRMRNTR